MRRLKCWPNRRKKYFTILVNIETVAIWFRCWSIQRTHSSHRFRKCKNSRSALSIAMVHGLTEGNPRIHSFRKSNHGAWRKLGRFDRRTILRSLTKWAFILIDSFSVELSLMFIRVLCSNSGHRVAADDASPNEPSKREILRQARRNVASIFLLR